jgi:hypothetical protein
MARGWLPLSRLAERIADASFGITIIVLAADTPTFSDITPLRHFASVIDI